MNKCRNVVFAPHDDGGGAFAVLCRLARALLNEANEKRYKLRLYFLNSSAGKGGPKRLNDLTWSGDPLPKEGIEEWKVAHELRNEINEQLSQIRGVPINQARVAYIVTGKTVVWNGIVGNLKGTDKKGTGDVAIIDLKRETGTITFLEKGGEELQFVSSVLENVPSEERHLATCRASDFGITRSAGGVLGFAETRRPSVLVDEPGHWLGRIQREQCHEAGLCIVIPVAELLDNPTKVIQKQANKLGTNSDLDQTAKAAAKMPVGAERDLAKYLFETYIE